MESLESRLPCRVHISALFPEILVMIFTYLDVRDKGHVAQVCRKWRDAAYHRIVWRGVEAKLHLRKTHPSLFPSLVKRGIKRMQILSHAGLRRSLKVLINGIPTIESLNMSGCFNVTDRDLDSAFARQLPTLTELNLSLCKQITVESINRIACSLKNLEVLELGGCTSVNNRALLDIACELKRLRSLNLRSCRNIGDHGIGYLAGQIQQSCPSSTTDQPNQKSRAAGSGCPTTSTDQPNQQPRVAGNANLQSLGLQDCQKLTDLALSHISVGLVQLKSVNLSFCGSITDTGLRFLSKMPSLQEVNLRSCDNISDIGIGYLAEGASKITTLDVSFCERIGDQALIYMSQGLFLLKSLSLNACAISDEGLARLVQSLHEMHTLNIGQCSRVTDRGLRLIAENLRGLQCIDLYGCTKITTVGLEHIMQLQGLKTLNLGLWQKR